MKDAVYKKYDAEIDVIELMWRLFSQWKAIVIFAILIGVAFTATKYKSDYNEFLLSLQAKEEADQLAELPTNQQIEAVLQEFSESEQQAIMTIAKQQELVDLQSNYINDSIWLNTDPTRQRVLTLCYHGTDAGKISGALEATLVSESFINKLGEVIDPSADPVFIRELILKDKNEKEEDDDVFIVRIVLNDDTDAEKVEDVVTEAVGQTVSNLNQFGKTYSISLFDKSEGRQYNSDVIDRRTNLSNSVNSLRSNINSNKAALNDKEKAALTTIMGIINNGSVSLDEEQSISAYESNPSINKKYMLIGIIGGALIYFFIYIVVTILKRILISPRCIANYTGARVLGAVYYDEDYRGMKKLLHSKHVSNCRYYNLVDDSGQITKAVNNIVSVCEHNDINELTILNACSDHENVDRFSNIIANKLMKNGISVRTIIIDEEIQEEEILEAKAILGIAGKDIKRSILAKLTDFCMDYNIPQVGYIYISPK